MSEAQPRNRQPETGQTGDQVDPPAEVAARDLAAGRRVLELEGAGLAALAGRLDGRFVAALDLLWRTRGRVIVTGMGKSGHVARKLAATLASTGTPALFVHPGEASHGDLGMITPQDSVLALSNSGNTAELAAIIGYCKRFAIPLLGIVGRAASQLAEEADVALILPETPEACPLGLAPTTSTTMMLALGDALAVALLERRGFTAQDFQVLHPGGALGARLLRVKDLMHGIDRLPLARPETPMSEAILAMSAQPFGCVGIVDAAGRLVGIVTDGDLRRHMDADLLRQTAGAVMTRGPKTIRPQALAAEAIGYMNDRRILSLFVVEDERPLGIVQLYDCLRAGVA
jgi:arabinose-5-phosphate isomerase